MIPIFTTGRLIITKWGNFSTFDIPIVAEYLIEQLWECQMFSPKFAMMGQPVMKVRIIVAVSQCLIGLTDILHILFT